MIREQMLKNGYFCVFPLWIKIPESALTLTFISCFDCNNEDRSNNA